MEPFQWMQRDIINLSSIDADLNLSNANWSTVSLASDLESSNPFPACYGFLLNLSCDFVKIHLFFLCFSAEQKFLILSFIGASSSLRPACSWGSTVEEIWVKSRFFCFIRLMDSKVRCDLSAKFLLGEIVQWPNILDISL